MNKYKLEKNYSMILIFFPTNPTPRLQTMLLIEIFVLISPLIDGTLATQLVRVSTFGDNPSGIQMFEYVPVKVAANPALLVAIHW
jgi:hypothetical protein